MLNILNPLTEPLLFLDYEEEGESVGKYFLVSEEHDDDDSSFVPPGQTFSFPCLSTAKGAESSRSHYEGKKLPQVKQIARKLLLVFPELLEEVTVCP